MWVYLQLKEKKEEEKSNSYAEYFLSRQFQNSSYGEEEKNIIKGKNQFMICWFLIQS